MTCHLQRRLPIARGHNVMAPPLQGNLEKPQRIGVIVNNQDDRHSESPVGLPFFSNRYAASNVASVL
ncbi:hypothetical protein SAMN05192548_101750 [Paraburkholderia terricola]|uniref:Uncharacterized protein n=1 Tax=Paraburkholderia terricola TaxID=169427 RepID=A0A1M6R0W5_9BURK|nr:hypothetical protein SAMN05192547_101650 [Paraburkholderia sediminicola]SHK26040.1 hypothetical protein SAMN05192548_101750 [Paraburkholderia terricola]